MSQASVSPSHAFALQSTTPVSIPPCASHPPCHTQLELESQASVAPVMVPVQPVVTLNVQPGSYVLLQ